MCVKLELNVDQATYSGSNSLIDKLKIGDHIKIVDPQGRVIFEGTLQAVKLPSYMSDSRVCTIDDFLKPGMYRPAPVVPTQINSYSKYSDLKNLIETGHEAMVIIHQGRIMGIRIFGNSMYLGVQLGPNKTDFRLEYYEEYVDFMMALRRNSRPTKVAVRMNGVARKLQPESYSFEAFKTALGFILSK